MSGPKPPETGPGADEPGDGEPTPGESQDAAGHSGDTGEVAEASGSAEVGEVAEEVATGQTDAYSQAYSAPESEHFSSGPYVPVDPRLYDYDSFDALDEHDAAAPPRWPWVVGVTTIIAAIALVVSVALLFARTETADLATPDTTTTSLPPMQDEITTTTTTTTTSTTTPPPSSEEPSEPETTESSAEAEPIPEPTSEPPVTPATTTPAGPKQVTYSITGTKAPFDQVTITYIDASGQRRTLRNAYIPWSLTLTPISQSEVGSLEASSLLRLSRLNCSITSSDGTVLSSNSNDAPQTSC
ncbi:MAG TPA: MmpS family transport accessory protein [Mycobacterium sp.]|nr:MmpS family transport accessory protein [Mycobacterium sp.]